MANHTITASCDADGTNGIVTHATLTVNVGDTIQWVAGTNVSYIRTLYMATGNSQIFDPLPMKANGFKGTVKYVGGFENTEWYMIAAISDNNVKVIIDPKIKVNPGTDGTGND